MTGYWQYPGLQKTKPDAPWFKRDQIHGRNWGCPDDTSDDGESDSYVDPRKPTAKVLESKMPV